MNKAVISFPGTRSARFAVLQKGEEEFCTLCLNPLGFSKQLHIDDPKRTAGGALYVEGCGQSCGPCNKQVKGSNRAA